MHTEEYVYCENIRIISAATTAHTKNAIIYNDFIYLFRYKH